MIVCTECGFRNPSGATFCENRDCGSFLEWTGDAFSTGARPIPAPVPAPGQGPGWERGGPSIPSPSAGTLSGGSSEISVTMRLAERELSVEPGHSVAADVVVKNTGNVVDQYTLQVFGEAGSWATVDPPSINLVPNAEGPLKVTFHPPRRADVLAGMKPFRLLATSRRDLRVTTFVDGTITVDAFEDLASHLRSQYGEGPNAVYEVLVENRGNTRTTVQLAAVDELQALTLAVSHPALSVPPGGWASAQVRADPRAPPVVGQAVMHPFRVLVRAGSDEPQSLDAQFAQAPAKAPVDVNWWPVARVVLTLLGALLMVMGAAAEWERGLGGLDLTYATYVNQVFDRQLREPSGISTTLVSMGLPVVVLAALAAIGVFTERGRLTRVAGMLAALLMLAVMFTLADADIEGGSGPLVVLFGAIVAVVGGIAARVGKS
jgi:hypothetical protein